jgi:transportin-1
MDLISSIFSALNEKAQPFVIESNFIIVLREFIDIRDLCIKQYVFAMVGDLQKHLGFCIKDKLPEFINCAIANLYYNDSIIDPTKNQLTVCNNACWSLGEMAMSPVNKDIIKPYTEEIVQKLQIILSSKKINKSLA